MAEPGTNKIFIVIGEESGDQLAASLIDAFKTRNEYKIVWSGLAGTALQKRGVTSLFPLSDLAVMGIGPVLKRLPNLIRRVYQTVDAIIETKPDCIVLIDSPDFTHAVAKRVRARDPSIPIIGWISPSVWAWRQGRAKKMAAYIDHLLCILPFEPAIHKQLGGPPCTYIGHPLIAKLDALLPKKDERAHIEDVSEPEVLVLPGSRTSEVAKLLPLFKETLLHTKKLGLSFKVTIPAVEHLAERIEAETRTWPFKVDVVTNEQEKHAAFRKAHAALAASGTVSLELALSKIPMVIAYKLDFLANKLRFLVKVWTVILPNLILGRPAVREYIDEFARADSLAYALGALLRNTPERRSQIESFDELIDVMQPQSDNPAKLASEIILKQIEQR